MARRPFFSGNYGSALGSTANAANIIAKAGEQQGQRLANMGAQIGGMIQQYGLNKEKRAELTGEIEAMLPKYMQELTMSGNEDSDKKNMQRIEKFRKGDSSMADLRGLAGELAMKDKVQARAAQNEARIIANEMGRLNLDIAKQLKDTRVGIEQDKGVLSKLTRELVEETNPQKKELIQLKITDAINDIGMNPQRRALESEEIESKLAISPSETAAKIATNELTTETAQASKNLVPLQTADKKGDLAARSTERKIVDEVIEQSGGIPGIARKRLKAGDLSTANIQSQIDYRNNMGLAQLYKSLAEKNPTFEEQFTPLAALQDKLRGLIVKTPKGRSVTYAEYEKLHNKEPGLYPMNNEPGAIRGQIESVNLQIYNLSREQPVQVNVPEEPQVSASASTPTNLMGLNYDYSNLDPSVAELMAGPGAVTQQITDPAIINMLRQGGTIRGKNLEQLIAEGAIIGQ